MRLIDADELRHHKFLTPDAVEAKKWLPKETKAYQQGWNDAIQAVIDASDRPLSEIINAIKETEARDGYSENN